EDGIRDLIVTGVQTCALPIFDRMSFDGSWKGTGQFRPLGLNEPPGRSAVTLYTPVWGAATPAESGTVEAILAPFPATTPNVTLRSEERRVGKGGRVGVVGK